MKRQRRLDCDVLTLGKGLGSGMPLGMYGLSRTLAEGLIAHRDGRADARKGIATGGMIHSNPLSAASALAMLKEVQAEAGYARISALGSRLAAGIEAIITSRGLPWSAFRCGPRSIVCLTPVLPRTGSEAAPTLHRGFNAARRVFMANRGVWDAIYSAGSQIGFSHQSEFSHKSEDVDAYLLLADEFLGLVT